MFKVNNNQWAHIEQLLSKLDTCTAVAILLCLQECLRLEPVYEQIAQKVAEQVGGSNRSNYSLVKIWERRVTKWPATEQNYLFKINQSVAQSQRTIEGYQQLLHDAMDSIIRHCKQQTATKPNDRVSKPMVCLIALFLNVFR